MSVRAIMVMAGQLLLSRLGTAAQPAPVDQEATFAGVHVAVHHSDTASDRVYALQIGAVDIGVGLVAPDAGERITLTEGTLEDRSAAVIVTLTVDHTAQVTVCRLGAPACTPQVRATCADDGCVVRLSRGLLTVEEADRRVSYRVKRPPT